MKKTISLLLSLCMLATMMFAFNVPADAVYIYEITEAHQEFFFDVSNSTSQMMAFTVTRSGYYMIQTFGYEDSDAENPAPMGQITDMCVIDENNDYVAVAELGSGCELNQYIYCELQEGEVYGLEMTFAEGTQYCRLLFTNTEARFKEGESRRYFNNIRHLAITNEPVPTNLIFTFTQDNMGKAQVVVLYNGNEGTGPSSNSFQVDVDCMYDVNVLLLDPYSIYPLYYGQDSAQRDLSYGGSIILSGRPSFLVVYFDRVNGGQVMDFPIEVTITFS